MFKAFGRKKNGKSKHKTEEKAPENAVEQYKANVVSNIENGADQFPEEPRAQAPLHEDDFGLGDGQRSRSHSSDPRSDGRSLAARLPDYMADQNAVLQDNVPWRHGHTPDYSAANSKFRKERTHEWPTGSLEDLVSNLVKNWEKEASYKTRLEDWRTINTKTYKFSCNGGRKYTADEMMEIGTYNALIQEAAFYSAKHTSFDDSHKIFRNAMPEGFPWEVTEVYSGPPVVAFKWRHWGKMTGKLVCPVGPETKLEALPTNQELELFGVCVAHMDSDLKLSNLEIFYDPHELMASLVDARNLSYSSKPDTRDKTFQDGVDFKQLALGSSELSDEDSFLSDDQLGTKALNAEDFVPPHMLVNDPQTDPLNGNDWADQAPGNNSLHTVYESAENAPRSRGAGMVADLRAWQETLDKREALVNPKVGEGTQLPSDDNLLASMMEKPLKSLPGSRCPFPHN